MIKHCFIIRTKYCNVQAINQLLLVYRFLQFFFFNSLHSEDTSLGGDIRTVNRNIIKRFIIQTRSLIEA